MYRFKVPSIKILRGFSEFDKLNVKFIWKKQWPKRVSYKRYNLYRNKYIVKNKTKQKNSCCFLEECRSWLEGIMREISGMVVIFYKLMTICVRYIYVKIHEMIYIKFVHFTVCMFDRVNITKSRVSLWTTK